MQASRLKKFALAVALSLSFAFAYRSLAQGPGGRQAAPRARAALAPAATVLYGRSVARFAGYALDISFTPDGRLLCFGIAADPPPAN